MVLMVEGDLADDILEDEVGVVKACEEMVEVLLVEAGKSISSVVSKQFEVT